MITVIPVLAALAPRADLAARVATALRREYRRSSQEAISAVGDVTSAESVLIEGDPGAVLAEQGDGLDLLVVGSRGYGPIRSALLGAVSAQVIRRAPCPVLVATRGSSPRS